VTVKVPLFPPSPYQDFLHSTIQELHDDGLGYRKIAYWLNDNGYKTPRGHEFKNTHVFSILKKRRLREERYSKKPSYEYDGFEIRYVDDAL